MNYTTVTRRYNIRNGDTSIRIWFPRPGGPSDAAIKAHLVVTEILNFVKI
jgi:hypothetical protein